MAPHTGEASQKYNCSIYETSCTMCEEGKFFEKRGIYLKLKSQKKRKIKVLVGVGKAPFPKVLSLL